MKAVLVETYERIHRSNLVGMGVLPLQFKDGESIETHGLDGTETFEIVGLAARFQEPTPTGGELAVRAVDASGATKEFNVRVRIDTPEEANYYRHGGILQYVLRRLAN